MFVFKICFEKHGHTFTQTTQPAGWCCENETELTALMSVDTYKLIEPVALSMFVYSAFC